MAYFDENLNFQNHITFLSNKLPRALYSLNSVRSIQTPNSLSTLYYTHFHCHLIYAIEIWSTASPSALLPLITKQKAAIRIIANKIYDHTEPISKELSILPLPDLILNSFTHMSSTTYLLLLWAPGKRLLSPVTLLTTNVAMIMNIIIFCHRTDQLARMPLFNLPRLWNHHFPKLTEMPHKQIYSKAVITLFLHKLSLTPNCTRRYYLVIHFILPEINYSSFF
jgi:hypothetical protein